MVTVIAFLITACSPALGQLASRGCSLSQSQFEDVISKLSKTSGSPLFDAAFNKEYAILCSVFEVKPSLFIMDDSGGPNAFAYPRSFERGFRGSILFGLNLFASEMRKSATNFTVPAIMAHEFGHILQFVHTAELEGKNRELQADYMAGWYMKKRDLLSGWSGVSVLQTMQGFYATGDYDFNSPQHHGTPQERARAVLLGVRDGNGTAFDAYVRSENIFRTGTRPEIDSDDPLVRILRNGFRWADSGFSGGDSSMEGWACKSPTSERFECKSDSVQIDLDEATKQAQNTLRALAASCVVDSRESQMSSYLTAICPEHPAYVHIHIMRLRSGIQTRVNFTPRTP
jgi:hypothetical protein